MLDDGHAICFIDRLLSFVCLYFQFVVYCEVAVFFLEINLSHIDSFVRAQSETGEVRVHCVGF